MHVIFWHYTWNFCLFNSFFHFFLDFCSPKKINKKKLQFYFFFPFPCFIYLSFVYLFQLVVVCGGFCRVLTLRPMWSVRCAHVQWDAQMFTAYSWPESVFTTFWVLTLFFHRIFLLAILLHLPILIVTLNAGGKKTRMTTTANLTAVLVLYLSAVGLTLVRTRLMSTSVVIYNVVVIAVAVYFFSFFFLNWSLIWLT